MSEAETIAASNTWETKRTAFKSWCAAQGISITGIDCNEIPNSGLGIVAQRRLQAGEEIVNVPFQALITINTVPNAFRKNHRHITTQGLLASFLASSHIEKTAYAPWASTWPTLAHFRESMPLCWRQHRMASLTEEILDETTKFDEIDLPLPPAIYHPSSNMPLEHSEANPNIDLLQRQRKKLKLDWKIVKRALPDLSFERYIHYWLLVNSRTFYFELPNVKTLPPRDDRIVMCPFVDLFNHHDTGCNVLFGFSGYTVTTDKAYDAGEELYVSYGRHSNDFLLVEYGFVLNDNCWDSLPIDHYILTHLVGTPIEERLQRAGYLGGYFLNDNGVCYRTQVATCAQFLPEHHWNDLIAGRNLDTIKIEHKGQALIMSQIVEPYFEAAEGALEWLQSSLEASSTPSHRPHLLLVQRWKQIRVLLQRAAKDL